MKGKLLPPSVQKKDQLKQDNFLNLEVQAIKLEKANTQEKYAAIQNKIITASLQNQNQNFKKQHSNLQEARSSNNEVNYEYTTQIHSKTPQSKDNKIVVKYSKMPSNYELYTQETPPTLIPQLNQNKYQINNQQVVKPYLRKPQTHLKQLDNDEQISKNQIYQSVNTTSRSMSKQIQSNQHQSLKNLQIQNKKPSSSHKGSSNQLELQQNLQISFEENEKNRKGEHKIQNDENGFLSGFLIDGQKLTTIKQTPLSAKEGLALKKIPPSNSTNKIQNSNFLSPMDSQAKLQALTKQISQISLPNKHLLPKIPANDALSNPCNQTNKTNSQINIPPYKQNKLQEKSGIDLFIENQQINCQNVQNQLQQNTQLQKLVSNSQNQSNQNLQSQQNNLNLQNMDIQLNEQLLPQQKQNLQTNTTGLSKNKNIKIFLNQTNNNNNDQQNSHNFNKSQESSSQKGNQLNIDNSFQGNKQTHSNDKMISQQDSSQINRDQFKDQALINKYQSNYKSEYIEINLKEQQLNLQKYNKRKDSDQTGNSSTQRNQNQSKNKLNEFTNHISQQNQIEYQKANEQSQDDENTNLNKQSKKPLFFEQKQNEKLSPTFNPQTKSNHSGQQINQKVSKKVTNKNKIPTTNEIKETKLKVKQEPLTIQQFELNEEFFRESFYGYNIDAEESLSGTWTGFTIQQYMKNQKQENEEQIRKQSAQKQKKKKNSISNIQYNENGQIQDNKNTDQKQNGKNINERNDYQVKSSQDQQSSNQQNQFIKEEIQSQEN